MWHLQNLPTSLFFHFSSLHTVQTALFLLMCCHTSVNKHAELWVCYHRSKPLELDPVAQNNFSCNAVQLVKQIIFIIFKNLSQMRGVCLCVYTCTHPSVPEQCERERIPQRVTHNQPHAMARKTRAARPWITPRTNLRLCDGGMRGSVTPENRWQVWKMKAEAGRFGHTTPMTLEEVKRDGAGMRDRLWPHLDGFPGSAAEGPWSFPKGHLQWPLNEDASGVPESAPRSPVLRVWMALGTDAIASRGLAETHDYLPVPTQSEKGALLPPLWGPWVGGDASVLVAAWQEQSQEVRKTPRSQLQMSRVALSVPLSSELLHTAATVWGQGKKYCWNMRERFLKVQPWSAFWRKERKTAVYFPVLGFEVKEHQGSGKAAWRFSRPLPPAILGRSRPVHFPNLQPYLWACLYSSLIHFQKPQQFLNQMTWLHSLNANHEIIALKKKERN